MNEDRKIEFKEIVSNTFLKTVSAFANYGTGKILFGVKDDGTAVGVKNLAEIRLDIENKILEAEGVFESFKYGKTNIFKRIFK